MKHIWRIIRFTGELWRYYIGVAFFSILIAAMSQVVPLLTKAAIDQLTKLAHGGQVSVERMAIYALLIFATDFGQTLFSNFGGYLGDILSAKQQQLLANRYYEHLLSLPQSYFDTELTGKIINRLNRGINQITDFTQTFSNNFLQFIFSAVFTLAIVAYYAWPVAIILFMMYPIFIWLTALTNEKWQKWQQEINGDSDVANGRFAESIGQVKVVKSFGQELRERRFFGGLMQKIVTTTRPQSKYWHRNDVIRRSVLAVINLILYGFIFIETARGHYTIGTMVLLLQYAQLMRIPLFSISYLVSQTQRAIANSRDYFDVMDEKPEITDRIGATKLTISKGEIAFDDIVFAYDKEPVLSGLTFSVESNSKVALVGESGEGKTTITNLLLRLYEVNKGTISIDGQNINDVTQKSLRDSIGVVFQDPALFSGTIRENIAYAHTKVDEKDVVAAAKAANAHDFIMEFEKGYDTEIGERGLKLSGGQKQRIAIARALLKDAPILILDEATSSLDSKSEGMVQEALERLMHDRTTIIIAHRLSTIQNVDKIITLRKGKVDEIGSPAELAKSDGIYAELLKLQLGHTEKNKEKLKEYEIAG